MRHAVSRMVFIMVAMFVSPAWAQSSSLYVTRDGAAQPRFAPAPRGQQDPLSSSVASVSLIAVRMPEPREFSLHDLVTIIVRESTESASDSKLDTTKESKFNGGITAFPHLTLEDLLNFQIKPGDDNDGGPKAAINMKNEFKGDGTASRKDSITARITARIIDIKPNGTLVLEARKHIKSDKEAMDMVLTGVCRKEDVSNDNTILSTQMADLRVDKQTSGELRRAAKKGWLTKLFDGIFAF